MSENFIKLNRSQETEYLLEHYPNAFLLLSLIALRARRTSGHLDGLEIGECYIGDHKKSGLSRQEYRTALKHLIDLKIIIPRSNLFFIEKSTNSSTTRSTNKGTLIRLLKSTIWDINPDIVNHHTNHQINHLSTTCQPQTRKNKKEEEYKKEKITKRKAGRLFTAKH